MHNLAKGEKVWVAVKKIKIYQINKSYLLYSQDIFTNELTLSLILGQLFKQLLRERKKFISRSLLIVKVIRKQVVFSHMINMRRKNRKIAEDAILEKSLIKIRLKVLIKLSLNL